MVRSLQQSIKDLLIFMVIVTLTMFALLTFSRNSFSYSGPSTRDSKQIALAILQLFIG